MPFELALWPLLALAIGGSFLMHRLPSFYLFPVLLPEPLPLDSAVLHTLAESRPPVDLTGALNSR